MLSWMKPMETRRQRTWLLMTLALTLLVAVLVPPSASATHETMCIRHEEEEPPFEPTEPVELCGVTRIEGSSTGVARVRLPQDTALRAVVSGPDSDVQVEGHGRFVGFALVENDPQRDGLRILMGRLLPDSLNRDVALDAEVERDADGRFVIPADDYLLYLIADGGPVSVTLNLKGLPGDITFSPFREAGFVMRDFATRLQTEPGENVWVAGDPGEVTAPGFAFRMVWVQGSNLAAVQYGHCFYDGDPPEPQGYAPMCPGATFITRQEAFGVPGVTGASYSLVRFGVTWTLPPGRYSQAAWYENVSAAVDGRALGFWLSLDG